VWLLLLTVGAAALVVLVTRGSWRRLVHLPVQGSLLFVTGVLLQGALEIVEFTPNGIETAGYGLLMLSYAFLLAFCFVNLPLRGMGVITIGIALNAIVIGLNLGMPTRPVSIENGRRVEKPIEQTVKHRPESPDDLLGFLGDKILLPDPFDALISIGDIVIAIGVCELAYFGSHQRRRRARQRAGDRTLRRSSTRSSAPSTRPSYT
jgi:Family of unknown function (DUF5317)